MIVKAFNQEFNINIQVEMSQFNIKVIKLIKLRKTDLLKELNNFILKAWKQYDAVKSEAWKQYKNKIEKKLDELLKKR